MFGLVMAALLPFMIMTDLQAARLTEATMNKPQKLEPRRVEAGPYAGKYVLREGIKYDPAFADYVEVFAVLDVKPIETDVAFPAPPED